MLRKVKLLKTSEKKITKINEKGKQERTRQTLTIAARYKHDQMKEREVFSLNYYDAKESSEQQNAGKTSETMEKLHEHSQYLKS